MDDKRQIRIAIEAESVLSILALVESGRLELISSEPLLFEMHKNPDLSRKEYSLAVLRQAKTFIKVNAQIEMSANKLVETGIKPLDALHLASAEFAQADYLCTTDDRLLKQAKMQSDLRVKVISPIQLIEEIAV